MITAQMLIDNARKYIGVKEGTAEFRRIIDAYNAVKPLPMGYAMKYTDDWCDTFVTHIADISGASALIGRECGVQRHIAIFEKLGIWIGRQFPKMGDVVTFDWDGGGWADHIGFVEKVENNTITTIEGNSNEAVRRNTFAWNDKRIKGYARPKYSIISEVKKSIDDLAKEVIAGKWSSGQERINQLLASGYDATAVQKKVNEMLSTSGDKVVDTSEIKAMKYNGVTLSKEHIQKIVELAKTYRILPSLLIVMLHFEGVWGASNVAKIDNNWGGMTWSSSYVGNPEIKKSKGSSRPVAEGGNYIHYSSVADFLEDWVYLLRPGGTYKVSDVASFDLAVKGLYKAGGAKYDYAALGYEKYLERMVARKKAIEGENKGMLDYLDQLVDLGGKSSKVRLSDDATHWQTGEAIPDWIKELEFDVLESKELLQTALLLGNDGIAIGWVMEFDLDKL